MYGDEKKTFEDTKQFVRHLATELKRSRDHVNSMLGQVLSFPGAAQSHAYELETEVFIMHYRTLLFQYLINTLSREDLEDKVNRGLRDIVESYRQKMKDGDFLHKPEFAITEHNLDYLINATDRYKSSWSLDRILFSAETYPRLNSILDVFAIEENITFSEANTTVNE